MRAAKSQPSAGNEAAASRCRKRERAGRLAELLARRFLSRNAIAFSAVGCAPGWVRSISSPFAAAGWHSWRSSIVMMQSTPQ